jgi:hypothetical protein
MVGPVRANRLNRAVEVEEERSLGIVANEALDPEERREARSSRHRPDVVKARRGIEHHVSRGELHLVHAEVILDHQLSPLILLRSGEEERRGQIGPDAVGSSGNLADRVVHVVSERLPALISIEERREDAKR